MKSITLGPLTADQEKYLADIREKQEFSDYTVKRCTCPVGGRLAINDPPCPIHGADRFKCEAQFDPALAPENVHNRMAASHRGWKFDSTTNMYRDADGSQVADRFGQPY